MRRRLVLLVILALLGSGTARVLTLPTAAACAASGRAVDPDGRHCVGPAGTSLLREHVLGTARKGEIMIPAVLVLAAALRLATWRDRADQVA